MLLSYNDKLTVNEAIVFFIHIKKRGTRHHINRTVVLLIWCLVSLVSNKRKLVDTFTINGIVLYLNSNKVCTDSIYTVSFII